ncbi:MAG: HD domain-containing protein [Candidatus Micrarchaeota archaeon]|nr:HD domain-containing protein [Candidatus Micrarchaeota archaeon]
MLSLNDVNYGSFTIGEPLLEELIHSKEIERLKKIDQMGVPKEYYPFINFSRYEHSIGVMLLLRKLGAGIEEQAAGLLHDASHTAFSHTMDWVLADGMKGNEDMQDLNHGKMLAKTRVPMILERYGLEFSKITDIKRYGLLETEAPSLCADRVDYALKEFYYLGKRSASKECAGNLTVFNGSIVFSSKRAATTFGTNYMELQNGHWGSTEAVTQYYILARLLKTALSEHVITLDDVKVDDQHVINKLKTSGNGAVAEGLRLLSYKGTLPNVTSGIKETVYKKFRYVDPEYIEGGSVKKLSENDAAYLRLIEESRKLNKNGITITLETSENRNKIRNKT